MEVLENEEMWASRVIDENVPKYADSIQDVQLISYTQPESYFAENTTELVAFCARVSNPSNIGRSYG